MPWVRTRCHACGLVTVPAEELTVMLEASPPRYSFTCPTCDRTVVRVAGQGGLEAFRVLPDVVEAEVARFRDALAQDDWFDRLLTSNPGQLSRGRGNRRNEGDGR